MKKNLLLFLGIIGMIASLTAGILIWRYSQSQKILLTQEREQVVTLTNQVSREVGPLIQKLKNQVVLLQKDSSLLNNDQQPFGRGIITNNSCTYSVLQNGKRVSIDDKKLCAAVPSSGFSVAYDQAQNSFVLMYAESKEKSTYFATLALTHIKRKFEQKETHAISYWLLADENGNILMHPQAHVLQDIRTIDDMTGKSIKEIIQSDYQYSFVTELTGTNAWISCAPLEGSSLYVCSVIDIDPQPLGANYHRRTLIQITLLICLAVICAVLLFLLITYPFASRLMWSASFGISMITIAAIGVIWFLNYRYPNYKRQLKPVIRTQQIKDAIAENKAAKWHIPTGMLVTHLQFEGEGKISLVGYVWQRYDKHLPKTLERGFIFPQALSTDIEELSTVEYGNTEVKVWRIQTTLNQYLTYMRYPFDVKNLQIQLWSKEFNEPVLLTPDLNAYPLVYPRTKPGIGPSMHINDWSIQESYFAYRMNDYRTNFGLYTAQDRIYHGIHKTESKDLYFTISLQRHLLETIINNLLPLMVIALLLFVILLTSVWQGYAIIASCSSVFFGTVLAQVRLHEKIFSSQLVYFDNFYFPMYVAILAILTVGLLYHLEFRIWAIRYKRNLIAKLLYWPLLSLILLAITLIYLY